MGQFHLGSLWRLGVFFDIACISLIFQISYMFESSSQNLLSVPQGISCIESLNLGYAVGKRALWVRTRALTNFDQKIQMGIE